MPLPPAMFSALAIDQIDLPLADDPRQLVVDCLAAGPADDVAEAEDADGHWAGV